MTARRAPSSSRPAHRSRGLARIVRAFVGFGSTVIVLGVLSAVSRAQAPADTDAATRVASPERGGPGSMVDAQALAPNSPIGGASLPPKDLSPIGMFRTATLVVKGVMVCLALASAATWTAALAKGLELGVAKQKLRVQIAALSNSASLGEAIPSLKGRGFLEIPARAALAEMQISGDLSNADGIKERIASRLERIEVAAGRHMARGTGILATTGAIAPFVGLFGTVWGIMNSFIGISNQHTTNLAVVAPGIAEALLATAMGLIAAIPAVVIYNLFSRSIIGYRVLHADGCAEILRLASRDLDRRSERAAAHSKSAKAAE